MRKSIFYKRSLRISHDIRMPARHSKIFSKVDGVAIGKCMGVVEGSVTVRKMLRKMTYTSDVAVLHQLYATDATRAENPSCNLHMLSKIIWNFLQILK